MAFLASVRHLEEGMEDRKKMQYDRLVVPFLWRAVLDFVYPPHCLLCSTGLEGGAYDLCAACACRVLDPCDQPLDIRLENDLQLLVLSDFNEDIRQLIHLLKYQGKTQAGRWLGRALGQVLRGHPTLVDVSAIVPVPLHAARKRERGYNQSAVIAQAVGAALQVPVIVRGLKRLRHTPTQTHLDVFGRRENVAGVFAVRHARMVAGQRVLIIDDVVTTGATVLSCVEALLAGGAASVVVGAVAHPTLNDHGAQG